MALALNLEKSKQTLSLNLQKAGIITPPSLQVNFVLDVSGSFDDEHCGGLTNDLLTRLVPWALTFDPDKKMDVFTFSNGERHVHKVGSVNESNYDGYVKKNIINKVPGYNGGTDYSYVLEETLREAGWIDNEAKKSRFMSKLFGKKDSAAKSKEKSLVVFVTDGENSDKARTLQVLEASEQRGDGVYFLFIGVANGGGSFPFIEDLGRKFNNTGFYKVSNLKEFVNLDDQALNEKLLQSELIDWMKA